MKIRQHIAFVITALLLAVLGSAIAPAVLRCEADSTVSLQPSHGSTASSAARLVEAPALQMAGTVRSARLASGPARLSSGSARISGAARLSGGSARVSGSTARQTQPDRASYLDFLAVVASDAAPYAVMPQSPRDLTELESFTQTVGAIFLADCCFRL